MPTTRNREAERDRDGAVGLKYVGDGSGFPDIPARDLTIDELSGIVAHLAAQAVQSDIDGDEPATKLTLRSMRKLLLDSGLYIEAPITAPAPPVESEG